MSAQNSLPASLALTNFAHFTSMRVESGRVRGLARHLERLDRDSWVVFGTGLDEAAVRAAIKQAIKGATDPLAVRVTVHAPDFDPRDPAADLTPQVAVTTAALPEDSPKPLGVRTAGYQRDLPQVKHTGLFGLYYQRRLATRAGFDDVLFVNPDGEVSEGSTWNVCFHTADDTFVWPSAPALPGIAMSLVQSGLHRAGAKTEVRPVTAAELPDFRGAYATNALRPVRAISHVDETEYAVDPEVTARLLRAHDLTAAERV
ncbi:aminotransferase class IV [Actinokineospora auranticolor]|uniref:Branched-subunit amino acid aminotransferase/4-amino-4-deoxychorismate lyase n=1 Tax=Actinokineospora auranticolor TaxID=155976 RepID=A0A2S6GQX1_9PSEU|nr:aminotransferase class IV [Actinokineospora auranticolor]PPK67632.1 branched-subunit amino acid aminotransferase/4-amino-4-deoxychorismate lyase [Actinokineospora auranticolor]